MEAMRQGWTDERLDEFGKRMDERFDHIEERFDHTDEKFGEKFDRVDEKFIDVDSRLGELTRETNRRFDDQIRENNRRFDEAERQIKAVDARLMRVEDGVIAVQRGIFYGAIAFTGAILVGFAAMTTLVATQL
ncbi:MAG TPA: hypothetical protein VFJ57_01800 [Solirubrobacterales bacterium]|nr:hypothetical protein [Solirubrobacterales bacterium]